MNIKERKEEREHLQSENLLSIIRKEFESLNPTIVERDKNDRPDLVLKMGDRHIGIEVTECHPSFYNKGADSHSLMKDDNWLRKECRRFLTNPYFVSFTKDQCYRITVYVTNAIHYGRHKDEFQKELQEHIEAWRFKRPVEGTTLIMKIKVVPSCSNFIDIDNISRPSPVKWSDVLRVIEKKENKSKHYDYPTDELWLNIYIPWVENIVSFLMNIEDYDISAIKARLEQSRFKRIYLSSLREEDTFVLKTDNGVDMLDEEHCVSTNSIAYSIPLSLFDCDGL